MRQFWGKGLRDEVVVGNRIMNEAIVRNRVKRLGR